MRAESREMNKPSWFALGYFRGITKELGTAKISSKSDFAPPPLPAYDGVSLSFFG